MKFSEKTNFKTILEYGSFKIEDLTSWHEIRWIQQILITVGFIKIKFSIFLMLSDYHNWIEKI